MRKRLIPWLLAMILVLIPLSALGMTEEEWQAQCRYITTTTATIYYYAYGESVDENGQPEGTFVEMTTLPAGTYIKVGSARDSKRRMSYLSGGNVMTGYITPGDYQSIGGGSDAPKATPRPTLPWTVAWDGRTVEIVNLGTVHTDILVDGEVQTVDTADLSWDTEAEAKKQIACVNKKSINSLAMREKMDAKSTIIEKIPCGSMVIVQKVGKKYTRIYYHGEVGYVLGNYLNYYPIGTEADTKVLAYNGYTNGKTTIKVRFSTSKKSRVLAELPTGTRVDVIEVKKSWSKVEVNGLRGYIMNQFLQNAE